MECIKRVTVKTAQITIKKTYYSVTLVNVFGFNTELYADLLMEGSKQRSAHTQTTVIVRRTNTPLFLYVNDIHITRWVWYSTRWADLGPCFIICFLTRQKSANTSFISNIVCGDFFCCCCSFSYIFRQEDFFWHIFFYSPKT